MKLRVWETVWTGCFSGMGLVFLAIVVSEVGDLSALADSQRSEIYMLKAARPQKDEAKRPPLPPPPRGQIVFSNNSGRDVVIEVRSKCVDRESCLIVMDGGGFVGPPEMFGSFAEESKQEERR